MNSRILLITKNFPPMVGGMERLMGETCRLLTQYYIIDLVIPLKSQVNTEAVGRIIECRLKPLPVFIFSALIKTLVHVSKYRPAICMAGSGVTAPVVVIISRLFKLKSVIYVHGLDLIYPNWIYQKMFVPFIRMADRVIANSENTSNLAVNKGVQVQRIRVLNPGTSIPTYINEQTGGYRIDHILGDLSKDKIILSFGRLVPRKGIREFLQYAFPSVRDQHPDVLFVIAGPSDQKYADIQKKLEDLIVQNNWQENVLLAGKLDDEDLSKLLGITKVFVFPIIDIPGDVEGFGMVAIEAASYGVPTVAFRVGGVTDAISHGKSGYLIDPSDYNAMSESINKILANQLNNISKETCRNYAKEFSWEKYGEHLKNILDEIIEQ